MGTPAGHAALRHGQGRAGRLPWAPPDPKAVSQAVGPSEASSVKGAASFVLPRPLCLLAPCPFLGAPGFLPVLLHPGFEWLPPSLPVPPPGLPRPLRSDTLQEGPVWGLPGWGGGLPASGGSLLPRPHLLQAVTLLGALVSVNLQ